MTRALPLRVMVPLAVVVTAVIGAGLSLSVSLYLSDRTTMERAEQVSLGRLSQMQEVLEAALRRGDQGLVQDLVAGLGSDRSVSGARLIQADTTVIASTRFRELGRPAPLLDDEQRLLERLAGRQTPVLTIDAERGQVLAGITVEHAGSTLGGTEAAVLMVRHDAGQRLRDNERTVIRASAAFGAVLALAVALIAFVFRRFVTARTDTLLDAAAHIAAGRFETRTGLVGQDELAGIGQAVDAMAARLEQNRRENQASEQRYQILFEHVADPILVAAPDGRYLDANPAACALVGYTRDELLGMTVTDLMPPEDRAHAPQLDRLREQKRATVRRRFLAKSGERIPVDIDVQVTSDGRLLGLVTDLRQHLEGERLRSQLATQDRLAALGTLAASVGHEINNPLTYVLANLSDARAFADALPEGKQEDFRQLLSDAVEGAERVRHIVADLHLFARPSSDDASEGANLTKVLRSAVNMAGPAVRERTRVVLELGPAALPSVRGDERRLTQVLLNLLENAAHAMPDDRPPEENRIEVTVRDLGDSMVVEVQDNGRGIPPHLLARIFEPFFTTKPMGQGTGLGLSISREIVTQVGGALEVDSVVGRGTVFRLRLPKLSVRPPAPSPLPAPRSVTTAPAPALRILVVDDEPLVARTIARALRAHQVVQANGTQEGLQRCKEADFDRIFCDLSMPDGGGKAFFEGLLAVKPALCDRLVFVTGGAASESAAQFLEESRRPVLLKPFDQQRLEAALYAGTKRASP